MDVTKQYKNAGLERKRLETLRTKYADSLLKKSKLRDEGKYDQIFANVKVNCMGTSITHLDELVRAIYEKSDIFDENWYSIPVAHLADCFLSWIRNPKDWKVRTHNARRQFSSLLRHLLCKYEIPAFMDSAFTDALNFRLHSQWFIHMGNGNNIRKAGGLPIPLTKKQAHYFCMAPDNSTINEALRYGQIVGMGGTPRLAEAINGSLLREFKSYQEPFWETVIHWFMAQAMFDYNQVAPMIDYINHERFERRPDGFGALQPNFTMHGRTVDSLMKQMEVWHRAMRRIRTGKNLAWERCSIQEFERIDGLNEHNQKHFEIRQLLTSHELKAEGTAMHHCVYSYAQSCYDRKIAIFSLKKNSTRVATLEVNLSTKLIVQARGRFNDPIGQEAASIVRAWASQNDLKIYSYCRL